MNGLILTRSAVVLGAMTWLNTAFGQSLPPPTSPPPQQPAVAFPEATSNDAPPPPPPAPPYAYPPAGSAAPPPPAQPEYGPAPGYGPAPQAAPDPQPGYAPVPAAPPPGPPMYAATPAEAPYVAPQPKQELKFPDFSVRLDPLNWVLQGRLGIELEVEAFEWLTIETVPVFVVNSDPVVMPENIRQQADGWGPLAGASLSAGFWLEGDSFRGTVLRVGLTNYAYKYKGIGLPAVDPKDNLDAASEGHIVDQASLSEQRLSVLLGSGRRWGYFTVAGGFGLEYELNHERRCLTGPVSTAQGDRYEATTDGCKEGTFSILRRPNQGTPADLRGVLFPFNLVFRFSVGFVLDRD